VSGDTVWYPTTRIPTMVSGPEAEAGVPAGAVSEATGGTPDGEGVGAGAAGAGAAADGDAGAGTWGVGEGTGGGSWA